MLSLFKTLVLLCFHQSALFHRASMLGSSRSVSFHGCQCVCQCPDGSQFLEFHRFLASEVVEMQICSLERIGASVKWITARLAGSKSFMKNTLLFGRQIVPWKGSSLSRTCLDLRVFDCLWKTYVLLSAHNMDTCDKKKLFLFTILLMSHKLGKSTK